MRFRSGVLFLLLFALIDYASVQAQVDRGSAPDSATAPSVQTSDEASAAQQPDAQGAASNHPCDITLPTIPRTPQPLSAAEECAFKPKDTFKECDKCPEMVVVPAGMFTMGSPLNEIHHADNEGPQHSVSILHAFAIGKFPVTLDQFSDFAEEAGYDAGTRCWTFEEGKWEKRSNRTFRNPGFSQTGLHPAVC